MDNASPQLDHITRRLYASLDKDSGDTNKEFWYGFLVACCDFQAITLAEYQVLRNAVTSA